MTRAIHGLFTTTYVEDTEREGCQVQHFRVVSDMTGEILDEHYHIHGDNANQIADWLQGEDERLTARDNVTGGWVFLGAR